MPKGNRYTKNDVIRAKNRLVAALEDCGVEDARLRVALSILSPGGSGTRYELVTVPQDSSSRPEIERSLGLLDGYLCTGAAGAVELIDRLTTGVRCARLILQEHERAEGPLRQRRESQLVAGTFKSWGIELKVAPGKWEAIDRRWALQRAALAWAENEYNAGRALAFRLFSSADEPNVRHAVAWDDEPRNARGRTLN